MASPETNRNDPAIIIVPGFDYEEQLRLEFSMPGFSAAWFRRSFTKERAHCNTTPSQHRMLCYGNNVTVLLRACFKLSQFHDTPGFWSAIATGWSIGPRAVEDMVDVLVRARRFYRIRQPARYDFHSGATKAADNWIHFIDNGINQRARSCRPNSKYESDQAATRMASDFYNNAKSLFLQDDAAGMLTRRGIEETQRHTRKRSPSPTPPGPPRDAKRRSSPRPDWFEKRSDVLDPAPSSKSSLPPRSPLTTDVGRPEQAKQESEYPTPISTSAPPDKLSFSPQAPQASLGEHHERKIRGIAQQDSHPSPPAPAPTPVRSGDPVPEKVSVPPQKQEAADIQRQGSGSTKDVTKTASTTARAETALITQMQIKMVSLEQRLSKAERDRGSKSAKDLISFETRMAQLEEFRSAQAVLMQMMQAKLAIMENISAPQASPIKPASQDHSACMSAEHEKLMNKALEDAQKDATKMRDRLSKLEMEAESLRRTIRGMSQTNTSGLSPTPPEDIQRSMEDVIRQVKALPTMHNVSEKTFQIEQHLRDMLEEYKRNNNERVDKAVRDMETMQVQVRGLAKEFNKAVSYMPAKSSLAAVQEQVARLRKDVDAAHKSNDSQDDRFTTLADKVGILSAELPNRLATLESSLDKLSSELHDTTPASLSGRMQELSDKTDSLAKDMSGSKVENQANEDLASINTRVTILTEYFLELLGHLHGKGPSINVLVPG